MYIKIKKKFSLVSFCFICALLGSFVLIFAIILKYIRDKFINIFELANNSIMVLA